MTTRLNGLGTAARISRNGKLLAGVSALALTFGFFATPALAVDYPVIDDGSLRAAIGSANIDGAASSTITLSNDVTLLSTNALPVATKDLTIDGGSFSFLRSYASGTYSAGVLVFGGAAIGTVTLKGKVTGINGGGNTNGQYALTLTGGTNVVNDAIVTAGDGSGTGVGGVGSFTTSSTLTNNGTITGGNSATATGGNGIQLSTGATLINTATSQGGNGRSGGGSGVTTSVSASTITNSGTIRGGNATVSGLGGVGVQANFGSPVTNSGSIFGGNGVSGGNGVTLVSVTGVTSSLNNSGTVTGGNGTTGAAGIGVSMFSGGSLTNSSSGTIQGGSSASGANGVTTQSSGSTITNNGAIRGGTGATDTGGNGVTLLSGSLTSNTGATLVGGDGPTGGSGLSASGTALLMNTVNNGGTITGGNGTTGNGGAGATLTSFTTLTNTGTITGGNSPNGQGGSGVTLSGGSVLNNSGTIQGGTGPQGGIGVDFGGPGTTATLNNSGTILGQGANAILVRNGAGVITNTGTIQGGNGFAAILDNSLPAMSIVDGGTITAGTGYANAIEMGGPTQTLSLELHKGYVINGNVVGNAGVANTLILGGDDDASFDVSTVGPQYQNFTAYQKTGNSTWALTGIGSVATPWTISQGTLAIGDGASVIGDITNNATLAFTNSNALTFANTITGTGGVNQTGSGRTNLTGTSTYSGTTTISGGTLAVNGSIVSAVTVASGGTLGGNGTVGATTVQSGGNIAPGNSIGTLHINGAFAQNAGSVYQVEVDPTSNASDLILVNGTATIASGATVNVTKNPAGNYVPGAQYTVLTASGGVTGSYSLGGQTAVSQYLAVQEQQDANNIYLRVVQTSDPASAAQTGNQAQTATGTDSLPDSSSVGSAVLNTPDPGTTRSAFDALSGEAISSAKSALVSGSLLVRDTTFDRLRDVFCASDETRAGNRAACASQSDKPAVWAQGFGSWGHVAGNGNASGLTESVGGFLVGVDMPIYDWRVGYFGGFSRTDFSVNARSSSGNSNNYHIGMYGGTQWGDLGLRLGASYSWNNLATARSVTVGNLSNDLRANYNASTTQVFGELGQRFGFDQFTLEPFANVAYVNLRTGGFSETGGDAALTAKADTTEDTFTTLGVRPSTDISWGSFNATARGMAGWRHAFGDVTPTSTVSFAGSDTFTVAGVPIARDAGVVEAGLDFLVHGNVSAGITYGGQFSDREVDHSIRGTLAITF